MIKWEIRKQVQNYQQKTPNKYCGKFPILYYAVYTRIAKLGCLCSPIDTGVEN